MTDSMSQSVQIVSDSGYYKVLATQDIPKGAIVLAGINQHIHNSCDNYNFIDDPALDLVYKMIKSGEDQLFPRQGDTFFLDPYYVKIMNNTIRKFTSDNTKKSKQIKKFFDLLDTDTLTRFYAKFVFNAFSIDRKADTRTGQTKIQGSAINVMAARVNHSCLPNVRFYPRLKNSKEYIEFMTIRNIKAGEELFNSYLQNNPSGPTMSTEQRQEYLKLHYDFRCECSKCIR